MSADPAPTTPAKRHGKRRVADARAQWVHVRCNVTERATIAAAAAEKGLTAGAYLRGLALGAPGPRARRAPRIDQAMIARVLGEVGKLGSNVNQLARAANTTGDTPAEIELAEIGQDVQAMRSMLMQALGRDG